MKTLYQILGIDPSADPKAIKRAYFLMAKKYHPDSGDQKEVQKFYEVTQAYKTLSSKEQRKLYDLSLGDADGAPVVAHDEVSRPRDAYAAPSRSTHGQNADFRRHEMESFHRRLFYQAVLKVVISALVGGVAGNTLALIFVAPRPVSIAAGVIFAFFWSINRHFNLATFIRDPRHLVFALWGGRALMFMSALYFAALFARGILRAF